jgi:hypothetical protein
MSICTLDSAALGVVILLAPSLDEETDKVIMPLWSMKFIDDELEMVLNRAHRSHEDMHAIVIQNNVSTTLSIAVESEGTIKIEKVPATGSLVTLTFDEAVDPDCLTSLVEQFLEELDQQHDRRQRFVRNGPAIAVYSELKLHG